MFRSRSVITGRLEPFLLILCGEFCALMGMVVSVAKTKVLISNIAFSRAISMDLWV